MQTVMSKGNREIIEQVPNRSDLEDPDELLKNQLILLIRGPLTFPERF